DPRASALASTSSAASRTRSRGSQRPTPHSAATSTPPCGRERTAVSARDRSGIRVEHLFHVPSRLPGMQTIPAFLFPLTYLVALVVERVIPARPLPRVRGWLVKGILFFAMSGVVTTATPALIHALLGDRALLDLSQIGVAGGVVVGLLAIDVVG